VHALEQRALERVRFRRVVARAFQVERRDRDVAVVEAGLDSLRRVKPPQQEARADREHETHRDLQANQHAARALGPLGGRVHLDRAVERRIRRVDRRREPEGDARDEREADGEREHGEVRARVELHRRRVGREPGQHERDEAAEGPEREQRAERAARERDQHALREQLLNQAAARRSERQAQRDLAAARGRAREQQVRDVRAGDQQHQRERGHHDRAGAEHVRSQLGVWERRRPLDHERGLATGLVAVDARRDHGELGAHFLYARAGAAAADHNEPAQVVVAKIVHARQQQLLRR